MHALDKEWNEGLLSELEALDKEMVEVDGKPMRPSQCYHLGTEPAHVLFNTNCPESLKEKVNRILAKYSLF